MQTSTTDKLPESSHSQKPHCHECSNDSNLAKILETVCEVAIGIFAATAAPVHFFSGMALGAAYQITLILFKVDTNVDKEPNKPGCGQSNGEMFMGRGLLRPEIIVITSLFFFEHLEHHPTFFAPVLGAFLGVRTIILIQDYFFHKNEHTKNSVS